MSTTSDWFLKKTTHGWGTVSHLVTGFTEFNGISRAVLRCGGVYHQVRYTPDTILTRKCPECKRIAARDIAMKLKGEKKPYDYVESFEWIAGLAGGAGASGWMKDTLRELLEARGRKK